MQKHISRSTHARRQPPGVSSVLECRIAMIGDATTRLYSRLAGCVLNCSLTKNSVVSHAPSPPANNLGVRSRALVRHGGASWLVRRQPILKPPMGPKRLPPSKVEAIETVSMVSVSTLKQFQWFHLMKHFTGLLYKTGCNRDAGFNVKPV